MNFGKRIFFFYNYRLHFYRNTIEYDMLAGRMVSTKHDDSLNFLELDLLFYEEQTTSKNSSEYFLLDLLFFYTGLLSRISLA